MTKLNLGCGFRKKEGFINVDSVAACEPDELVDLATTPWPWPESSVEEVHFDFSLEQIGSTPRDLLSVLQETYRVSREGAKIQIFFFHPRHDQFVFNPLCVHRLSPEFFQLLSMEHNLQMIPQGQHDSLLALQLGVNFKIVSSTSHISVELKDDFEAGRLDEAEIRRRLRYENNICQAVEIHLEVSKLKGRR